jgi:hypothetical protein
MNEIKYPSVTTYFISYEENDDNPHYGEVNSDQYMITPKTNMFTTTDKEEYIVELSTYGITLEETTPPENLILPE